MKKPPPIALPEIVVCGGYIYLLSDEPLQKGDWYVDHQMYNWNYGNPIEDVDSEGLADFINREGDKYWHSKKISKTTNPRLLISGVENFFEEY